MWSNIQVGDYGWTGKLTIVQDDVAQDISSYTTRRFIFLSPSGARTAKTATFVTDGTDGALQYTVEAGVINEVGRWAVQARISKAGVELTSEPLSFEVAERLD